MRAIIRAVVATSLFSIFVCNGYGADSIRWQPSLEAAHRTALQTNRLVLVHCYTNSCAPCAQLERNVFSQTAVADAMEQSFVPVKLDVNNFPAKAKQWGVTSVPSDVILSANGQLITTLKVDGRSNPQQYLAQINSVPAKLHANQQQLAARTAAPTSQPQSTQPKSNSEANPSGLSNQPATIQQTVAQDVPQWPAAFASSANPSVPATVNNVPATVTPWDTRGQTASHVGEKRHPGEPQGNGSTVAWNAPSAHEKQAWAHSPPAMASANTIENSTAAPFAASQPWSQPSSQPTQSAQPYVANQPAAGHVVAQNNSAPFPQRQVSPPAVARQQQAQAALAMDGYCAVSLVDQFHLPAEQQRWVKGDARWGAVHRGRTYLFAGEIQQKRFLADPDTFSPALSGNDPILSLNRGVPIPGSRAFGLTYSNRIYLFANEASLNQFCESPDQYVQTVRQAEMPQQTRLR